jgi:hypothetical protein
VEGRQEVRRIKRDEKDGKERAEFAGDPVRSLRWYGTLETVETHAHAKVPPPMAAQLAPEINISGKAMYFWQSRCTLILNTFTEQEKPVAWEMATALIYSLKRSWDVPNLPLP